MQFQASNRHLRSTIFWYINKMLHFSQAGCLVLNANGMWLSNSNDANTYIVCGQCYIFLSPYICVLSFHMFFFIYLCNEMQTELAFEFKLAVKNAQSNGSQWNRMCYLCMTAYQRLVIVFFYGKCALYLNSIFNRTQSIILWKFNQFDWIDFEKEKKNRPTIISMQSITVDLIAICLLSIFKWAQNIGGFRFFNA